MGTLDRDDYKSTISPLRTDQDHKTWQMLSQDYLEKNRGETWKPVLTALFITLKNS